MSSVELFVRYFRKRLRLEFFAVIAAALAVAAGMLSPGTAITLGSVRTSGLEIFFFIIAFRIWDDLADREHDRARHPERIMTNAGTTKQFTVLGLVFLGVAMAFLLAQSNPAPRIIAVAVGAAIAAVWYLGRTPSTRRMPGSYLVLVKYPMFTYAAAPYPLPSFTNMWPRAVLILTAIYVAICVYETIDDTELRTFYKGASLP